eukprot:1195076-Prorocentrum_minimum.AAC.2
MDPKTSVSPSRVRHPNTRLAVDQRTNCLNPHPPEALRITSKLKSRFDADRESADTGTGASFHTEDFAYNETILAEDVPAEGVKVVRAVISPNPTAPVAWKTRALKPSKHTDRDVALASELKTGG